MDAFTINEWLIRTYGNNPFNKPKVKLVHSSIARELRHGTYNEYYGSIYLRTITGTRETSKYPYIDNKWVLEQWYPAQLTACDELVLSREGSYEPIYVFQDKDNKELPLNLRVVELITRFIFNKQPTKQDIKDAIAEELAGKERETDSYIDSAVRVMDPTLNALHMREGLGYSKELKHVTEFKGR